MSYDDTILLLTGSSVPLDLDNLLNQIGSEVASKWYQLGIAIGISEEMLAVGRKKIAKKKWEDKIQLYAGDAENLDFEDNNFDAVTVAFGVRNFENLEKGWDKLDILVNAAGIEIEKTIEETSLDDWNHRFQSQFCPN